MGVPSSWLSWLARFGFRGFRELLNAESMTKRIAVYVCCRYSSRMPASLITLPMLAISALILAANSCGELPTTSAPTLTNFSRMSVLFNTFTVS